jgi:hypothetical protein
MESHGDDGDASWGITLDSAIRALPMLPAETSGASRRNARRNENFAYSVSEIPQGIFNMP